MTMHDFWNVTLLMLMLLNPFLIVIYLTDIMKSSSNVLFSNIMIMAGLISIAIFSIFALLGEFIFERLLQADIASFQIFGGIVFLIIALKFMFFGEMAISNLRAESKSISSSIAMPILVGPGTIGVSILAGKKLDPHYAVLAIFASVAISIAIIIILKIVFDYLSSKKEGIVEKYVEISGKIGALIIGTYAIDMIFKGIAVWIRKFVS